MKHRIKAVTDSDGKTLYYPQYKFLCWWFNFSDYHGLTVYFYDFDKAKHFIEYKHIAKVKIIEL